jgi:cysteine protease ATG4
MNTAVVFMSVPTLARSRFSFTYTISPRWGTDSGWGCMLRSLQMMVAHALRLQNVERDNGKWLTTGFASELSDDFLQTLRTTKGYAELLTQMETGCFSLPSLLKEGAKYGIKPWSWAGPRHASLLAADLINNEHHMIGMVCHVAKERTVVASELLFEVDAAGGLMLLIPCRLGTDHIEAHLHSQFMKWLRDSQCIGCLCGPPQKGLYAFASGEDEGSIFCLDPHSSLRIDVPEDACFPSDKFMRNVHSHRNIVEVEVVQLDPECAFGFHFADKESLNEWLETHISESEVTTSHMDIFSVVSTSLEQLGDNEVSDNKEKEEEEDFYVI